MRTFLPIGCAVALAGCTVGPDFQAPVAETPPAWSALDPAQTAASTTIAAPPALSRWWSVFHDGMLDALVERALAENLDLRMAVTRVRESRAVRAVTAGGAWPSAGASADVSRTGGPNGTGGRSTSDVWRAGFDASWELDLFGGIRRSIEASDADLEGSLADRDDVQISLLAEIATTYFELRGTQEELAITRRNLAAQEQSAELTRTRNQSGFVGALDVATAEGQVASTSARIPTLEADEQRFIHALSVLLARPPADLADELASARSLPPLPAVVAVGWPADLVRRRPDVRRAESALHAITARIGVATADLYPRLSLGATLGISGPHASSFGRVDQTAWSLGPALSVPLFRGGALEANVELQRALADETFDAWRKNVLVALQEVEDALLAYAKEQERATALEAALRSQQQAVELSTTLYTAGRTGFLTVLDAQRSLFSAEDALSLSRRQLLTDLVALFKALGGGYEDEAARTAD